MRLVDADALKAKSFGKRGGLIHTSDIDALPTIDAVPVRHGRWIEENTRPRSGIFCCSLCHRPSYDIQPTRLKGWKKQCRYAFCPNCGARMDLKDGERDG